MEQAVNQKQVNQIQGQFIDQQRPFREASARPDRIQVLIPGQADLRGFQLGKPGETFAFHPIPPDLIEKFEFLEYLDIRVRREGLVQQSGARAGKTHHEYRTVRLLPEAFRPGIGG